MTSRRVTLALFAALSIGLSACGGDKPIPEHGTVTDAKFTSAWTQWVPGNTSCSGNPVMCTTTPSVPIYWPNKWTLQITDLHNSKWQGEVAVSQKVYDQCNLGELWPDCSRGDSGDTRQDAR